LEYLQSIELGIAHREVSLHRRTCKLAQKGTFLLLGAMGTSLYSLYTKTTQSWQVRCLLRSQPADVFRLIYGSLGKILSIIQRTAVAMPRWFNLLRCFSPVPQR
jgi:hypothetical protein